MFCDFQSYMVAWAPEVSSDLAEFGRHWTGHALDDLRPHNAAPEWITMVRRTLPMRLVRPRGFVAPLTVQFQTASDLRSIQTDRLMISLASQVGHVRLPQLRIGVEAGCVTLAAAQRTHGLDTLCNQVSSALTSLPHAQFGTCFWPRHAMRRSGSPLHQSLSIRLSDPMPEAEAHGLAAILAEYLAPMLTQQQRISDLVLMANPGGNRAWQLIDRYPMAETPQRPSPVGPLEMDCSGPSLMVPLPMMA